MKRVLLGLLFLLQIGVTYGFDQQGFSAYNENDGKISAACKQQCVAVGPMFVGNDFVNIEGEVQGQGVVVVGFMVHNQIIPILQDQVSGKKTLSLSGDIANTPQASQVPTDATIVLLIQGNIELSNVLFEAGSKGFFEKFIAGIQSATQYVSYTPRTINFMEGPMWNGKYINQAFIWMLVIWLIILAVIYIASAKNKKKIFYVATILFATLWMFLDMFSTINEQKMYFATKSNSGNIMKNGRLASAGDFYDFLEYITQNTTAGTIGYFVAPYPYGFEGKYHIYPHLGIGTFTSSKVIVYYNPMGEAAKQFGFTDPTIIGSNQMMWNNNTITFEKELDRKPYAKVFFIK